MRGNVLVLLDTPQHPYRTIYSRFNKLIRMSDLKMEWGGGVNYRINPFYYFIESAFLYPQLQGKDQIREPATYFTHIRHYSIFELALILEQILQIITFGS
jgi:hypothetical protein